MITGVSIPARRGNTALIIGGSGFASTPDHASFATTNLDVEVTVALNDWTPATTQALVGQSGIIADIGWSLAISTSGTLSIDWSADGTLGAHFDQPTTNPLGFDNGSAHTLRAQLNVNDGSGNRVITFYVDGRQFEQFTVAGTTAVFDSTQALKCSHQNLPAHGAFYSAVLRDGINGPALANPDFTVIPTRQPTFTDTAGRPWTMTAPAIIGVA